MKKIVVAFDSFKGSLSSSEASEAFIAGVKSVDPAVKCCAVAIADGGEGMAEAIVGSLGGEMVSLSAHDPLGRSIVANYGVINDGATAIIPISSASGLTLLAPEERNPLIATTYGTGELILDAIRRGCRRIIVGLGGSATNDGGTGLLRALGYRFLDANNEELITTIDTLERVVTIVPPENSPITGVDISVAVDVDNPLCGERGATYIYGAQKGVNMPTIARLDNALRHYADVVARWRGCDIADKAGMGAAGGAGGAGDGGIPPLCGAFAVVYPVVREGYRTEEEQQEILDDKIQTYINQGYSQSRAERTTKEWVALPGTSEHQLGIAVDINADKSKCSNEEVYAWLAENAYKYGFILRYPQGKLEMTGISYEPWHYRYVGEEAALEIYEQGICLEEYFE